MNVRKVIIRNFRSFGPEATEIELEGGLTGIIGGNSAGKTTLMEAIRKVFGMTTREREIVRSDFHIPKGQSAESMKEMDLSIEIVFDFEEEDDAIPTLFEKMVLNEPGGRPFLRIRLSASWIEDFKSVDGFIETHLFAVGSPESSDSKESLTSFSKYRSLIQAYYVPAIRQPSAQLKYVSGSVLHRLLNRTEWSPKMKDEFEEKMGELNQLFTNEDQIGKIQGELRSHWGKYHKDDRYSDATFTFGGSELESVLKKLELEFTPSETGRPYKIQELGEGYRSLFYLSLVNTLLKIEEDIEDDAKPLLTLLLIEEPENHISPQLLGRIIRNLMDIGQQSNVQVLLTSHTPSIIGRLDPKAIRHIHMDEETHHSICNKIKLPESDSDAYKFVKEAVRNYPELYFARLVVIGEGDSEEIVLKRLASAFDNDFDDHLISFAPLGHRFVNHIWALLDQLKIPHVTLLDLDRERNGGGWGRIVYVFEQLIGLGWKWEGNVKDSNGKQIPLKVLTELSTRDYSNLADLHAWVQFLEGQNVFFSNPLDLDFLMLKAFPDTYKSIIPEGGGPRNASPPDDPTADDSKYQEKLADSIKATLKKNGGDGSSYSDEEKALMIWYNYHFLGRGKPVTHLLALCKLTDDGLKNSLPDVLKRMFKKIQDLIGLEVDE